jgi:hypothetical protein
MGRLLREDRQGNENDDVKYCEENYALTDCSGRATGTPTCIDSVKEFETDLTEIPTGWTCQEYIEAHQEQAA